MSRKGQLLKEITWDDDKDKLQFWNLANHVVQNSTKLKDQLYLLSKYYWEKVPLKRDLRNRLWMECEYQIQHCLQHSATGIQIPKFKVRI